MNKQGLLRRILDNKKAVIFDFDNIIADSEPYHFEAYSQVFARKGHTLDREEYWLEWTSKGGGAEGEIRRYNLGFDPAEIRREKDPIYSDFCLNGTIRLFPEALEVISIFKRGGYTLAIASGSYEKDIRALLSTNNIEMHFSAVVGKDAIARYKPDPETYLAVSRKLGIPPEECLAIEDADKGIKSAKGAGMNVIVLETPITRELILEGADLKLSGLRELSDFLLDLI